MHGRTDLFRVSCGHVAAGNLPLLSPTATSGAHIEALTALHAHQQNRDVAIAAFRALARLAQRGTVDRIGLGARLGARPADD